MSHTPTELQKHLQLNTTLSSRYSEVRAVVLNYCKSKSFLTNSKSSDRTPMEVDAVWKWHQGEKGKGKGTGKGKGKGEKGKGKGKGKGKYDKGKGKGKKSDGRSDYSKSKWSWTSDWWSSSSWNPSSSSSTYDWSRSSPMDIGALTAADEHSWDDQSSDWSPEQWYDPGCVTGTATIGVRHRRIGNRFRSQPSLIRRVRR